MSYCRWSCMDGLCDVYAYQSDEGYQIHLSAVRIMGPQLHVPFLEFYQDKVTSEEFFEAYRLYMDALQNSAYIENNLPYGTQSFCCADLTEFYHMMQELRGLGYLFPNHVLSTILEEIEELGETLDGS